MMTRTRLRRSVSFLMAMLAMYAEPGLGWRERMHNLGYFAKFFIIVLGGLFCLAVSFRACGAIVRERQQKTLDSLLTVPESRERILLAKWLGNYCYPVGFGIGLVGIDHRRAVVRRPLRATGVGEARVSPAVAVGVGARVARVADAVAVLVGL